MGEKKYIAYKVSSKNMSRNIYAECRATVAVPEYSPMACDEDIVLQRICILYSPRSELQKLPAMPHTLQLRQSSSQQQSAGKD